ncbi:hypothetical protein BJX64DRAFT_265548 [Aspergillus heterothallicus]
MFSTCRIVLFSLLHAAPHGRGLPDKVILPTVRFRLVDRPENIRGRAKLQPASFHSSAFLCLLDIMACCLARFSGSQ